MRNLGQADAEIQATLALLDAGRLAEAEAAIEPWAASHRPEAALLQGMIALRRGALDRALCLTGRAVQLDVDFPEALVALASVQLALGRPSFALVPAERAVRLAPDLANAHAILAAARERLGEGAAATADIKRAALAAAAKA